MNTGYFNEKAYVELTLKEKGNRGTLSFMVVSFEELANNCKGFFERRGVEFWIYQKGMIVGESSCGLIQFWSLIF
jgi:hypothetical protein